MQRSLTKSVSKETVSERHERCRRRLVHALDDINDGLTFKSPRFAERYSKGQLWIYLKLRVGGCAHDFHVAIGAEKFERVGLEKRQHLSEGRCAGRNWLLQASVGGPQEMLACFGSNAQNSSDWCAKFAHQEHLGVRQFGSGKDAPVLVCIVELVQEEKKLPAPARISLCDLKELNDGIGQMFYLTADCTFKTLQGISCREFDGANARTAFVDSGGEVGRKHLVQRRADIVDGICGDTFNFVGNGVADDRPDALCALRIEIGSDAIRVFPQERANRNIKVMDMGFGPF